MTDWLLFLQVCCLVYTLRQAWTMRGLTRDYLDDSMKLAEALQEAARAIHAAQVERAMLEATAKELAATTQVSEAELIARAQEIYTRLSAKG